MKKKDYSEEERLGIALFGEKQRKAQLVPFCLFVFRFPCLLPIWVLLFCFKVLFGFSPLFLCSLFSLALRVLWALSSTLCGSRCSNHNQVFLRWSHCHFIALLFATTSFILSIILLQCLFPFPFSFSCLSSLSQFFLHFPRWEFFAFFVELFFGVVRWPVRVLFPVLGRFFSCCSLFGLAFSSCLLSVSLLPPLHFHC